MSPVMTVNIAEAINADPTTDLYKSTWNFLTDSRFAYDRVEERIDEVEKSVRIAAKKQARAEYKERIEALLAETPGLHIETIVSNQVGTYWLRVAQLCGVEMTAEEIARMDAIRRKNFCDCE